MQSSSSLMALARSCAAAAGHAAKRRLAGEQRLVAATATAAPCAAGFHTSAARASAQNPGPVEKKLKAEYANYVPPETIDPSVVRPGPDGKKQYSAKIKRLADEICHLTLLETLELTDVLKEQLGMGDSDLLLPFAASAGGAGPAGGGGGAAAAAPAEVEAPKEEKKAEVKTHVDIKLKSFDAKNKIKVIKEIRGVTSLGLKEAKDLVESAPCTIMAKVKAEEAAKIIEKLKAETGGEFELV